MAECEIVQSLECCVGVRDASQERGRAVAGEEGEPGRTRGHNPEKGRRPGWGVGERGVGAGVCETGRR